MSNELVTDWIDIERSGQTLDSKSDQAPQSKTSGRTRNLHQADTISHDGKIFGNPPRKCVNLSICIVLKWKHLKRGVQSRIPYF